ncbi:uncharacterized protein LOC129600461 isoform X2 [Paramacrobiotus metropolitanus]|uniref:uncharacterized protein LOC129600461 isoform X2 n=1 Tax=Paramacrobiotus metropolitanus TaxID=2943436 RepID=UPI002445A3E5|nr:uncharacterized protein LOC129600461 isoform X2 [Paramacrobiotus metropolitanus]
MLYHRPEMIWLLAPIILTLNCRRVASIMCYECTRSSPATQQHLCPNQYAKQNLSAYVKTQCKRTSYCAEVAYAVNQGDVKYNFRGKGCLGDNDLASQYMDNPSPGCKVSGDSEAPYVYCLCNTDLCNNRTLDEIMASRSAYNLLHPVLLIFYFGFHVEALRW